MIYAKQVDPEYQESPIFDLWPEGIIVCGNDRLNTYTTHEFDDLKKWMSAMTDDWRDAINYYTPSIWGKTCQYARPKGNIQNILDNYGIKRMDGKPWSNKQKHQWRLLFEHDRLYDKDILCGALSLVTGHEWDHCGINGCCQSDWQDCYYDKSLWDEHSISNFGVEYWNLGTEWMIHDEESIPDSADAISGFSTYCLSANEDEIRRHIAECVGGKPEDVILYVHTGYTRISNYEERRIARV